MTWKDIAGNYNQRDTEYSFHRAQVLKEDQLAHKHISENCSHYYSLECPVWLSKIISNDDSGPVEGKIYCPNCSHKLGQYSWYGMSCSCGKWIVPSFAFSKSRIDASNH